MTNEKAKVSMMERVIRRMNNKARSLKIEPYTNRDNLKVTLYKNSNYNETEELLIKNICNVNLGAVTDVTDQFVMINLKGDKAYKLFQTGSPFNFNDFQNKKGAVTQTIIAKVDVIIHNQDKNDVNLFVRRSFSEHLFSWMTDAASRL